MRKEVFLKRRKFTTNTYMREAINYNIVIIKEENLFITIKKYKEMTEPFRLPQEDGKLKNYIDKNYYVVELTPIQEKYNIRYYFNEKKQYIDSYIDISYQNGIEYKIPYYVDLYLDILHYPKENTYRFCDEDELEDALKNKIISKKDYKMAYQVGNKLLEEIKNKKNPYMNIDVLKYLNQHF